jgi:hypothetical protein
MLLKSKTGIAAETAADTSFALPAFSRLSQLQNLAGRSILNHMVSENYAATKNP